jgi:hypothetical protein
VAKGTLVEIAESEASFEESLQHPAKRERWFAERQLEEFAKRGLKPNDLQCIGSKIPVVFAESANVADNAYVADRYEQFHFWVICTGQLPTLLTAQRSGSKSCRSSRNIAITRIAASMTVIAVHNSQPSILSAIWRSRRTIQRAT